MNNNIKSPKKLIEVALPLDPINVESLRRKQKAPKGWPTSFHKWWAQRPIAAARAVLFAQLVNDPGFQRGGGFKYGSKKEDAQKRREELFKIMEEIVLWDNSENSELFEKANSIIMESWREVCELNKDHPNASSMFNPEKLPVVVDPFTGSGTIPLESQRLGLRTLAGDLNPVAVMINKALMEVPYRFKDIKPTFKFNGQLNNELPIEQAFINAKGIAQDVRYYGDILYNRAYEKLKCNYPEILITSDIVSKHTFLKEYETQKLPVIAYIWARTVKSPNPVFSTVDVPLVTSFILSSKKGKEVFLKPEIHKGTYSFSIQTGKPPKDAGLGTTVGKRKGFKCLLSGVPISYDYIRSEGKAGRLGQKLLAVVVQGSRGRHYISGLEQEETLASKISRKSLNYPDLKQPSNPRDFKSPNYGLENFSDIFTTRQLTTFVGFSDLIRTMHEEIKCNAIDSGLSDDNLSLEDGGAGARAYADAICMYLSCILDRMIYYGTSLTTWLPKDNALRDCMPRQALAMSWDFAEGNPFGKSSGDFFTCMKAVCNYLDVATPTGSVEVKQMNASTFAHEEQFLIISTDPPYYDNINYADLSDFFYLWLRNTLKDFFPNLFSTTATPKMEELVASAYRHEGVINAEAFFMDGMTEAMKKFSEKTHPAFPVTIYYAFKQSKSNEDNDISSAGWETFLEAVLKAGFVITGTWPMRTEGAGRMLASNTNALASSIVLVCRKKDKLAKSISRRDFMRELRLVMPVAIEEMIFSSEKTIAPVDLSQAVIGPGMEVFSKYAAILEADGSKMTVRTALKLINRFVSDDDFDQETRFALHWFEQFSWDKGKFGDADILAKAKGTSAEKLASSGIVETASGFLRLLKWTELENEWEPKNDNNVSIWEVLHHLIRTNSKFGEQKSGEILAQTMDIADSIRALAYKLYTICERKKWAEDASFYNNLILSWESINKYAHESGITGSQQSLFES